MGVAAGLLAEIELPSGPLAPGAARMVIDHCLNGHGLELVELLTTRWGVMRDHNTSVWLEMERA